MQKEFKIEPGIIISKLDLKDGDNIIITVDMDIWDVEAASAICKMASKIFPNNKIVTTFKGIDIKAEKKMNSNLLKDLNTFCTEHNIKLEDLIYELKYSQKQKKHNEIIEKVNTNKNLVDLCFRQKVKPKFGMFPEIYRYYKKAR